MYKINMCGIFCFQQSNTGHQRRQHQLQASTLASTDARECFRFWGGDNWIAMLAGLLLIEQLLHAQSQQF